MKNYEHIIKTLQLCVSHVGGVLEHPEESVNCRRNLLEASCDMLSRLVGELQTLQDAEVVKEKLGLASS